MASLCIFFSFLLSLLVVFQGFSNLAESKECFIKAIYSFGDSIADTGNLLREGPAGFFVPIASFPYGKTFNKPTGRCSDGLLMIDYFALALNLSFINPYLDKTANFDNGVNFAVAGATALDNSFFLQRGIFTTFTNNPLSVQLEWFKTHLNSTCSSKTKCAQSLKRALFLVGEIGGNDYNYAFSQGTSMKKVMTYVPEVVQSIIKAAKEVISMGAGQLVVPGNFPIGCMPSYLAMFYSLDPAAYDEKQCLKEYNAFAMHHNKQLQAALQDLRHAYPHVTIMYADYYQAFLHLLDKAPDLGFDKDSLLQACCGVGGQYNFNINIMCGMPGASTCSNPSKHISWDGIHLTQEAYKVMAQSLIMEGFAYPNYRVQEEWEC
ncbi:GDSL esterase/lipase At5g03980 [Elaeis guineensis]|uniref:GDSL esterase/lipase At5g03980 n=1 Tax=Elaeis guineensis var. tenera TaxID=51953 RepID=A0A6I9RPA9_ELAGV|nr:GDSL esterase/lipase At5g03980 [Elaeis guineensis]